VPQPRPDRALQAAIANDQIAIRFQPQVAAHGGRLVGVEALARWLGALGPEVLFERAAMAGLTERLSRHVQRKALREAASWGSALSGVRLSLNCVAEDLLRTGYEKWLLTELHTSGFDPARLTLEITESSLVSEWTKVGARLDILRAAGIAIAIDDFGTGYANLAYLTSLPLDALKIDRGLLADIETGRRDQIVVRTMIGLARDLELKVVAEGVETEAQLALVSAWGCDLIQGFLIARALDGDELHIFAASHA
jgi:EAL domain-containing protein (putative c-di-GMP-specific phosphodiesterase class I)